MNTLIKRARIAGVIMLAAGLLTGCNQENTNVIAFVNMDKVLNESGLMAHEQAHLEQVKEALEAGAKLAESRYNELDKEKVDAARQGDAQILNIQWQSEQVSARNAVAKLVKEQAKVLLTEKKLTAILPQESALVINEKNDVSDDLIKKLQAKTISFGELPQISIKKVESEVTAPEVE